MAVYTIWGQAAPSPAPSFGSGGNNSYGTIFTLSSNAALTGIWYYSASGDVALPSRCGVWDVATQTEVAGTDKSLSPSWSGALGSGWVKCTYGGSVTLDTRAGGYIVALLYGTVGNNKGFNNITFPVTSGIITAPVSDTLGATNAPFHANAGWIFPDTSGGGLNWFVDVEVTTGSPPPPAGPVILQAQLPPRRPAVLVSSSGWHSGHSL